MQTAREENKWKPFVQEIAAALDSLPPPDAFVGARTAIGARLREYVDASVVHARAPELELERRRVQERNVEVERNLRGCGQRLRPRRTGVSWYSKNCLRCGTAERCGGHLLPRTLFVVGTERPPGAAQPHIRSLIAPCDLMVYSITMRRGLAYGALPASPLAKPARSASADSPMGLLTVRSSTHRSAGGPQRGGAH